MFYLFLKRLLRIIARKVEDVLTFAVPPKERSNQKSTAYCSHELHLQISVALGVSALDERDQRRLFSMFGVQAPTSRSRR